MTVLPAEALSLSPARAQAQYRARIMPGFTPEDWQPRPAEATVFQRAAWLAPFHDAVAEHRAEIIPLTAEVSDVQGNLAYRLPLLLRPRGRLRLIEFADLNMTDFNAPLLGPAAPCGKAAAQEAWAELRAALPSHDLLHFTKMPGAIGTRPNPLLLAAQALPCAANGNLLTMGEAWSGFHFGLEKTVRKELERSWRVFTRDPRAALTVMTDGDEAVALLGRMDALQRARMAELGQPYEMETPVTAGFHRRLLQTGVPSGFALLTTLTAGEELVAALLGVRDGETYVMIRLVHAGGKWSNVSPGRLLIHKTLELLHGQGYRRFDFSIGNYAYKRRFGPTRTPLYDVVRAATLPGLIAASRIRAGAALRQYPQARATVRRLLGKPASREEV
jgi:CelD/BcsL family acetyltransferase involved in cellulose biosynthesis